MRKVLKVTLKVMEKVSFVLVATMVILAVVTPILVPNEQDDDDFDDFGNFDNFDDEY